jgi:putative endopeptidase
MKPSPGIDAAALSKQTRAQDDLFRHVNGTWLDNTEIPEDKAIYGSFHMLADASEEAVKLILEEAAANPKPGVSQQIGAVSTDGLKPIDGEADSKHMVKAGVA